MSFEFEVFRVDTSAYQKDNYGKKEKELLEKIPGISYVNSWDGDGSRPSILITNSFTEMKQLKENGLDSVNLIIHPNSGYDNFDPEFVSGVDFPIVAGNPIRANSVANYILSALFSHLAPIPNQTTWDKKRSWNRSILSEKKVLLIGHGHIGSIVRKSISHMVKKLEIFDPYKNMPNLSVQDVDIVILASSLNPTSRHIINKQILDHLSDDFLLINGARGSLVDIDALVTTLKDRPNAHAYIDVFENEPAELEKYQDIPNITTTSHIAGVYNELDREILNFVKSIVEDFVSNYPNIEQFKEKYKNQLLSNRLQNGFLI